MATSGITRNFVVEGQDAEDFANSLDLAFAERDERMKSFKKAMPITDEKVIDKALERTRKLNYLLRTTLLVFL